MPNSPHPAIGIDFGTTKTVAAMVSGGRLPSVIPDRRGRRYVPSVVLASPEGSLAVGWEAVNHPRRYESEHFTITSIKRSMGRQGETGWGWWKTRPQEVAALILGALKLEVEASLGQEVKDAVIAIPAHFSVNQRWAVMQAAQIAGFNVHRLLNEATAAALRYAFLEPVEDRKILVFDFGGGTLDVSVLETGDGVYEVKATAGDDRLGGDDFDQVMLDYLLRRLTKEIGTGFEPTIGQLTVLREAARRAKIDLSASCEARICIPGFVHMSGRRAHDVNITVTRDTFRALSKGLLARIEPLLDRVVKDSGIEPKSLTGVVMIGGTTRMPAVQEIVRKILGAPTRIGIDPESGVAEGAALNAAVLRGGLKNILLLDVVPASLGIEIIGGGVTKLIERNTTFPTLKKMTFSTTVENQSTVTIRIFQGEHEKTDHNEFVGQLELSGIPSAPKGVPQIEVTFDIDANGTEHASAVDCATKRGVRTQLAAPFRLNPAQMRVMTRAVQGHLAAIQARLAGEAERQQLAQLCREAESFIEGIHRVLDQMGVHLNSGERSMLADAARLIRDYLERHAPAPDLKRLLDGIRVEVSGLWGRPLARAIGALVSDPCFADSVMRFVSGLGDVRSASQEVEQLIAEFRPAVDAAVSDLRLVAHLGVGLGWTRERVREDACRQAIRALQTVPRGVVCLAVILSHLEHEITLDLIGCVPAERDAMEMALRLLLVFRELADDKPPLRRIRAVKACSFFSTQAVLGTLVRTAVRETEPEVLHAIQAVLRALWPGDLYEYFSAAPFELRTALVSSRPLREVWCDTLVAVLPVKGTEAQKQILEVLQRIDQGGTCGDAVIRLATSSTDVDVRCAALRTLRTVAFDDAVPVLLGFASDDDPRIHEVARDALEECEETALCKAFGPESYTVRWRELLHVGPRMLRAWASSPMFLERRRKILADALPSLEMEDQRAIVLAIADLPSWHPACLAPLLVVVERTDDPEVRAGLITMITQFSDRRVVAPLLQLTVDSDPTVRARAHEALSRCRDTLGDSIARLIDVALRDHKARSLRDRFFLWRAARNRKIRYALHTMATREGDVPHG